MTRLGKYLTITCVTIACLSILLVYSANAQTVPEPHFTVKVIDGSFTSPVTYSTDPYTGQTTTQAGSTIQTRNVTLTINNAPQVNYYLVEYKGHYASQWIPIYTWGLNVTASASSGSQTIITISSSSPQQSSIADPLYWGSWAYDFAPNSAIDFRIQAINGVEGSDPLYGYSANHPIIVGPASPWSSIQTLALPDNSLGPVSETPPPTDSPNPTQSSMPSPTVPEFPIAVSLIAGIVAVNLLLISARRKQEHTPGIPSC
jgi:hypothetical protein